MRRFGIGDRVARDFTDHLTAPLIGRHAAQMFHLSVEHPDARWPVGLVAGEGIEIGIECLNVDGKMNRGLAAIHQHRDAPRMGDADDVLDRNDGAERIRHLGDGDYFRARRKQLLEFLG